MGAKIAYIMSRFPHLPETFILREMTELERQGWQIALYPLIRQKQAVIHDEAKPWLSRVRHLPFMSIGLVAANIKMFIRRPLRYSMAWIRALWESKASFEFLIRTIALLPKAVYAGHLMQKEGITHVHAHYATHPALVAWMIHQVTDISYSITAHAHDIYVNQTMLGTKLRDAAFISAISEFNREFLARTIGSWVPAKTFIVHCGIIADDYKRSTQFNGETRFEILSTGSLQPYKGQPYLIEACALLRDQGIPFRCRIIGEGDERPKLERMITELNLESHVELLGAQSQEDVARLLPTAHCYVQPSIITPAGKMEGIPVSLMEALACELPVVATSISGIPELVRPDETGYLVPPANAPALAEALATVYANPENAARMGRAGRALVLQEFVITSSVKCLAALFKEVTRPNSLMEKDGAVVVGH